MTATSFTHLHQMCHICRNQVTYLHYQNVLQTLVEEIHFKKQYRSVTGFLFLQIKNPVSPLVKHISYIPNNQ